MTTSKTAEAAERDAAGILIVDDEFAVRDSLEQWFRKDGHRVGSAADADSVLTCRIIKDTKRMIVQDWYNDPRQMQVVMQVRVTWVDRRGNVLRESEPIIISPATSTQVTATSILTAETGQSVATAHQLAITRAAEQIVGMMETPW